MTIVLIKFYDPQAMYLCVCKAVSERTVRRAIRDEGVVTLRELSRQHGVGTCCGKCVPAARELLERELIAGGAATQTTHFDQQAVAA